MRGMWFVCSTVAVRSRLHGTTTNPLPTPPTEMKATDSLKHTPRDNLNPFTAFCFGVAYTRHSSSSSKGREEMEGVPPRSLLLLAGILACGTLAALNGLASSGRGASLMQNDQGGIVSMQRALRQAQATSRRLRVEEAEREALQRAQVISVRLKRDQAQREAILGQDPDVRRSLTVAGLSPSSRKMRASWP